MKKFEYKIYLNGKQIESVGYAINQSKMREQLIAQYGKNITFGYVREAK